MWKLCIKNYLRSTVAQVGLTAIVLAGIISILIGKQHLIKFEESVRQTAIAQEEHINRNKAFFKTDLGLLFYYLKFSLVNEPDPLNGLSIGQRDVNPSIQSVTIRNLENQRYDTDFFNPASLHAGNLDLSFVLIYLFPLVIIASCFAVLSADKESGTWNMTRVQSTKPSTIIWMNLVVRMGFVFGAFFLLIVFAMIFLPLPLNQTVLLFVATAACYLLFWFACAALVISFNRKSSANALILLGCWILLTIVAPAMVNNYLTIRYPVPEAMATMVEQREAYHEKWDMEKGPTINAFYKVYPEYSGYGFPEESFSWLWYYAMQHMGDEESKEQTNALMNRLAQREEMTRKISRFFPSLHTQHQLNGLARAGLENHLRFLQETAHFHESLRKYAYPLIFDNATAEQVDWKKLKVQQFITPHRTQLIELFLPFLICIGAFGIISWRRLISIAN